MMFFCSYLSFPFLPFSFRSFPVLFFSALLLPFLFPFLNKQITTTTKPFTQPACQRKEGRNNYMQNQSVRMKGMTMQRKATTWHDLTQGSLLEQEQLEKGFGIPAWDRVHFLRNQPRQRYPVTVEMEALGACTATKWPTGRKAGFAWSPCYRWAEKLSCVHNPYHRHEGQNSPHYDSLPHLLTMYKCPYTL